VSCWANCLFSLTVVQWEYFRYETVISRWPAILTQVIDQISRTNRTSSAEMRYDAGTDEQFKVDEGKAIIEKIKRLIHRMITNLEME